MTEDRPFVESQQQAQPLQPLQTPMGSQWSMSRRAMLWGIAASAIVLPVVALGGYLTYQHLTDPHVLTYDAYHGAAVDAAWSPDGTRIAIAGWDPQGGTIQIVWALTGERLAICAPTTALFGLYPQRVIWSGDGRQVLSFVALDHNMIIAPHSRIVETVQVWDAATGRTVRSIPVMKPIITDAQGNWDFQALPDHVAFNQRYLALTRLTRATDNTLYESVMEVWDIVNGHVLPNMIDLRPHQRLQMLAWAPDQEKLALSWSAQSGAGVLSPGAIEIWDIATSRKVATLAGESSPTPNLRGLSWSPDSRKLVLPIDNQPGRQSYEIWDALTGTRLQTITPTTFSAPGIAWSPDSRWLVLEDTVYDVETGRSLVTYPLAGMLGSLAWSPEGKRVAYVDSIKHGTGFSSISSTLFVCEALTGRLIAQYAGRGLFGNSGTSGRLAWSPDGQYIMVIGGNIDIWRVG